MRWGYNTNGCQDHPWDVAIPLLAELGYQSVAITLDHQTLNPFSTDLGRQLRRMKRLLDRLGLRSVIETGARYLLSSTRKHEPTLVSRDPAERQLRIEFLERAIAIAADLESDAVSFWSGSRSRDDQSAATTGAELVSGIEVVLAEADRRQVSLALEPEPGMWIETTADAWRVIERLKSPRLGLTLDIGHVHCLNEGPCDEIIEQYAPHLRNVHIEDMRRGRHEHLLFGEGDIDFPPILAALRQMGYTEGVHVELSRHSHAFPEVARRALEFLRCQESR
jgi:sugar phosphate isomerase/epimerase